MVCRWFFLGLVTCALFVRSAPAIEPAPQSVEKLRALLNSIDPYHPKESVSGKLVVYGSGSMDGLMHAWADNFRDFHPQATVEVSGLPEETSMNKLLAEPTSIWMVSRPISSAELEQLKAKGIKQPVALEVAREALGIFVHRSNPVTAITRDQLLAVFTNQPNADLTWKLMGATGNWADKPIQLIRRSDSSGTQKFLQNVLFGVPMRDGLAVESNAAVVAKIKDEPTGIGICGLKCGGTEARPLQLIAGQSIIPSDDISILMGAYPLVRPMSIVFDASAASPARQEFIRYMLSQSGQSETIVSGLFPIDLPLLRAELQNLGGSQNR